MDRYAGGDDSAFSELYDALAPRLYAFAMRKVKHPQRAEDLVQQTMLQIHCARGRFVRNSLVVPWALAILRNVFLDQVKRKRIELLTHDGQSVTEHPSSRPGPEESALSREQVEILLESTTSSLSAAQQAAFEVVYYGQMSHAQAAETLGITVASVKLRVQRAMQAIRAALNAANAEGGGA